MTTSGGALLPRRRRRGVVAPIPEALEGQLKSLSGVDQARVDSIRESIADGSYAIDPDKVISGLLSAEKALL